MSETHQIGDSTIHWNSDRGIIEFTPVGDMGEGDAQKAIALLKGLIEESASPVRFLVNANQSGKPALKVRKDFQTEILENPNAGKVAILGMNPVARVISFFFMGATRKKDIKFFGDEKEARAWLEG